MSIKIYDLIDSGWELYIQKVSGGLLNPENEKMLQLQLALIYQALGTLYQSKASESINVLLEVPVTVRSKNGNIIDIVIQYADGKNEYFFPIELKCFRENARGKTTKRGAGNLSMYDYWKDIEKVELCKSLPNYQCGAQLTLTDDKYFVKNVHTGPQVKVYSTSESRGVVSGSLIHKIANRDGNIHLKGNYDMGKWMQHGKFYAINQRINGV